MNLTNFLGVKTLQEKVSHYMFLQERLQEIDKIGIELADRYSIQKSIVDDVDNFPDDKKIGVLEKYNVFLKSHSSQVKSIINERIKILKSIEKYRNDEELSDICIELDAFNTIEKAYKKGLMNKNDFFSFQKAISREPTKFADVIAFNPEGKILVLHRVHDFTSTGEVCIPGGHVEPGEDFEEAALRELKEETNLDPIQGFPITLIGEVKTEDVYIKYYKVFVDILQPVVLDATEHCFSEFIDIAEIPVKPFIFNQGENVLQCLCNKNSMIKLEPLQKAFKSKLLKEEIVVSGFKNILKKSLDIENAQSLMPESLEGKEKLKKKITFSTVDPDRNIERIMKAISGCKDFSIGGIVELNEPLEIIETNYYSDPKNSILEKMDIIYVGDEIEIRKVMNAIQQSQKIWSVKIKTPHEEFVLANENSIDYIGDPVFVVV